MSLEPAYVSEIYVMPLEACTAGRIGTGYLIGHDRVLTAAHVVQGARPPGGYCQVRPLGTTDWLHAIIAYSDPEYDIAVVELLRPFGQPVETAKWGRLGSESVACRAIGFPAFQGTGKVRDTEEFEGRTKPRSALKSGLITAVGGVPTANEDWSGMSGAALFADDFLVGVVVNAHVSGSRLLAQPIAPLIDQLGFVDALVAKSKPFVHKIGFKSSEDGERQRLDALQILQRRRSDLLAKGKDTGEVDRQILENQRVRGIDSPLIAQDVLGDRFELIEPIGKGGFAVVWKAHDQKLHRQVAVKILHGHYADEQEVRQHFCNGALQMSKLSHPGVVQVIEPCACQGFRDYFVMEFLPGGTFTAAVHRMSFVPQQVLETVVQIGEALTYAHERGVIHRDVKPDNLLIGPDGRPKLSDFDLVWSRETTGVTHTGQGMGSFLFSAPEALIDPDRVDQRADVYSLAMTTLFALRAGELPFDVKAAPLRYLAPLAVSEHVKAALLMALSADPDHRPESVEKFCRDLGRHPRRAAYTGSNETTREQAWYYYQVANAHAPPFWSSTMPAIFRLDRLDQALAAITNAIALAPDNTVFKSAERRWRAQKDLMELRGVVAKSSAMIPVVTPIAVELSRDWQDSEGDALVRAFKGIREERINKQYGVIVPGMRARIDQNIAPGTYAIQLDEVVLARGQVQATQMLAVTSPEELGSIESTAVAWGSLIDASQADAVRALGFKVAYRSELVAIHAFQMVLASLDRWMGHQEVMNIIERLDLKAGERLVREPRLLTRLVLAVRSLLRELVPITTFETIVEIVLASVDRGEGPSQTLSSLRRHAGIRPMLPGNEGRHRLLHLSASAEQRLSRLMDGPGLALSGEVRARIEAACRTLAPGERYAIVVRNDALRSVLRAALAFHEEPIPAVLSLDELLPARLPDVQYIEVEW